MVIYYMVAKFSICSLTFDTVTLASSVSRDTNSTYLIPVIAPFFILTFNVLLSYREIRDERARVKSKGRAEIRRPIAFGPNIDY